MEEALQIEKLEESSCVIDAICVFVSFFEIKKIERPFITNFINSGKKLTKTDNSSYEHALENYAATMKTFLGILYNQIENNNSFKNDKIKKDFLKKLTEFIENIGERIKNHYEQENNFRFRYVAELFYIFIDEEFPKLVSAKFEMPESCESFARIGRGKVNSQLS